MPRLAHPDPAETDPLRIVTVSLDWYRDRALGKLAGLCEEQLRHPPGPPDWSPLGLVQHLTWVERRWMRWGFAAERIEPYPPGDEWTVPADLESRQVIAAYREELANSRALAAAGTFDAPSAIGGRFARAAEAPTLGRLLVHLLQEYARHVGQLDIVREVVDGATGE